MLGEIQQRLETRFAELATVRRELKYPLYAIEHGLEDSTLTSLKEAASHSIGLGPPSQAHWLVWAALGAEAGYGYSGDEYWPALEAKPAEWRNNEHRQTLRRFYRRFAKEFGGPIPTGRWATQFSIISWPISHAVLPRYLQGHFARHLYDLRFSLARFVDGSGEGLGHFMAEEYDGACSRFRDFLQQTDLTTQIVLALRDEDIGGRVPRIEPTVLRRIVSDLEERRDAAAYLRDARKLIHSTAIKVSSRLQSGASSPASDATNQAAPQRPKLVARRQASGDFLLGLQLPDVGLALKLAGVALALVNGSRVRFAGEGERLQPASSLISLSRRERRLDAFPALGEPVFAIEGGAPEVARALEPISRIEERPLWVLRRQADGLYREILGGHVRPGQKYLILSRSDLGQRAAADAGIIPAGLATKGVNGLRLSVPAHLGSEQRDGLEKIGLGTITGVSVEPIGLNPAPSAGEELPAWHSSDAITLRLKADFHVDALFVGLDGQSPERFVCAGGELLLQLDHLEPGHHSVSVLVPARDGQANRYETFNFRVVEPRPWIAAMREKAGFRLFVEPAESEIERIFDGQANLGIIGPAGRTTKWSLEIYNAAGHLSAALPIGTTKIDSAEDSVRALLKKARADHAVAIDESYRIDIVAQLEELGRQAISFAHAVEPLRWKFDGPSGVVRLVDETDHAEPITVREYPLERPLERRSVDFQAALSGLQTDAPGSLFVAIRKKRRVGIFVSRPKGRIRDLADLGLSQSLPISDSPATHAIRLIDSLRRWERSKVVGDLGPLRKAITVDKLRNEIAITSCGGDFIADLLSSVPQGLERAQKKVGGSPGFGSRMRTYEWPPGVEAAKAAFCEFASTYGVENDPAWCAAALTLAYDPALIRVPENVEIPEYFTRLLGKRILLRGAFLAHAASMAMQPLLRASA